MGSAKSFWFTSKQKTTTQFVKIGLQATGKMKIFMNRVKLYENNRTRNKELSFVLV